jgi:hypothetical protein
MATDQQDLQRLGKLVERFEHLDENLVENLKNGDFSILTSVFEAKRDIKRFLAAHQSITVGYDMALKLKKIRDNYGYDIDRVLKSLENITGEGFSQEDEEDIDYIDALFSEGTADYVDENFFRRRNQIGAIVSTQTLPELFLNHLNKLKECYSLGLFEATIIYCRAVIETGGFEALKRRGKIKKDRKTEDIREYSLKSIMRSIKPFVYQYNYNYDEADKVIKLADKILHSKREKIVASEDDAFNSIKTTFAFIEELFR